MNPETLDLLEKDVRQLCEQIIRLDKRIDDVIQQLALLESKPTVWPEYQYVPYQNTGGY